MSTSDSLDSTSIISEASDTNVSRTSHGLLRIKFEALKFTSSLAANVEALRKTGKTQCKTCNKILQTFRIGGPQEVFLGSVSEFMTTKCGIHPRLVTAAAGGIDKEFRSLSGVIARHHHGVTSIYGQDPISDENLRSQDLYLVSSRPSRRFSCSGRIIDPNLIDTAILKQWKDECNKAHGRGCRESHIANSLPPPTLLWLIDASQKCLVPAQPGMTYIALSYVWGEIPMFKTSRADLERLQKAGALLSEDILPLIPRTILDAIAVVELAGEKYLWVDSLCIIQDDAEARHVQIRGMASIYANASFTIIAEQGENANFGLIGMPGDHSQPRLPVPERVELRKGWEIVKTIRDRNKTLSAWHLRGWTFQEHLFSQRRLVFGYNRVRWECYTATWYDDIEELFKMQRFSWHHFHQLVQAQRMFAIRYPHIGEYNSLVRHYNGRALSYPEDALAAFSGITTALSRSYAGGFICGMPVLFFDVALLWHGSTTLERRVSGKISSVGDSIPSWSWAGWRGEVYIWSWFQGLDYLKCSHPPLSHSRTERRVIPVLQWYSKENVNSSPTLVQPSWCVYRSKYTTGDEETPPGWTRHRYHPGHGHSCKPEGYPEPGVVPSFFYKHESDRRAEYWYPIPLVQGEEEVMPNSATPLISCRTLRTWLYIDKQFEIEGEPYVSVRDKRDRWAGLLFLPQPLSKAFGQDNSKKESCEIVMLSRGYSPVDTQSEERYHNDFLALNGKSNIYEYYNVLWIEWEGEIAYRKGIGRIDRKTWEREATEWIDLTLG